MHSRTGTRTCCKAKAKAKDLTFKAKAKAKDLSPKAKAKAKDMKIVLKDSLRTRPRPRTNITAQKPLKLAEVPQTTGPISAAGGPKFTILLSLIHI